MALRAPATTPAYDSRMRVAFLTGIWPPGHRRPGHARPGLRRASSATAGTRSTSSRWATASRPSGRCRSSRSPRGAAVRRSLPARRARPGSGSRGAPTSSTPPRPTRRRRRPPRRRAGRSSPSSSPTRPTSGRGATASFRGDARGASSRPAAPGSTRSSGCARASLRRARPDRRPEPLPRRIAARLGSRPRADRGARQPCAAAARRRAGRRSAPGTFVFVGRLTEQKALPVAIRRRSRAVDGANLVVVGDGPERARLSGSRASSGSPSGSRSAGALPRDEVAAASRGRRAAVLSSAWENLPHAAVEALAVGTPVVATAVGGVPEVVHDGENGLLVPAQRPAALAAAIRRVLTDDELRARLAAGAKPSVEAIGREPTYTRLEQILVEAAQLTPRVLFVGRGRLTLPLAPWLAKKWDALESVLDLRVLNAGSGTGRSAVPAAAGRAPRRSTRACRVEIARELRAFRPQVDRRVRSVRRRPPSSRAAVSRGRSAKVIVEVHGDPRTFTRGYGSPARRAGLAARRRRRSRSASGAPTRPAALSSFTSSLDRGRARRPATASLPDLQRPLGVRRPAGARCPTARRGRLRRRARAVQERRRARGGVAAGRPRACRRRGSRSSGRARGSEVIDGLLARPARTRSSTTASCSRPRSPRRSIAARALVLPSWPEGLGRVVLEAFARGRDGRCHRRRRDPRHRHRRRRRHPDPRCRHRALVAGLRAVLEDDALAAASARRAHDVRRLAPDGRRLRAGVSRSGRPDARRSALMRLVFVTQTLDPTHPARWPRRSTWSRRSPRASTSWLSSRATIVGRRAARTSSSAPSTPRAAGRALAFERALASSARRRPTACSCTWSRPS